MAKAKTLAQKRAQRQREHAVSVKKLGVSYGVARRLLLRKIARAFFEMRDGARCTRCNGMVSQDEEFHIDHIQPWLSAENPLAAYFSIKNIGIAHEHCNKSHGASVARSLLRLKKHG